MTERVFLPALQGYFGEWTYYAAIMPLREISDRIHFAREIHPNERLSELIQRRLQDEANSGKNRVGEIAEYIQQNPHRFFNAIVVGIYGGEPTWHPFDVTARSETLDIGEGLLEQERVGFLELKGTERLFALDGQHRVAGVKRALLATKDLGTELMTVLFVPHQNSDEGLKRTRRLFVDLNKRAVPVGRKDIIALDEIDLPAIIARRLVDDHTWFSQGQIDTERFGIAIPKASPALMTIGTLYDIIKRILPTFVAENEKERDELKSAARARLPEERISHYQAGVLLYFELLGESDEMLAKYLKSGADKGLAEGARAEGEDRALFRPIGQRIFADVITDIAAARGRTTARDQAKVLPKTLSETPFVHVIWDDDEHKEGFA